MKSSENIIAIIALAGIALAGMVWYRNSRPATGAGASQRATQPTAVNGSSAAVRIAQANALVDIADKISRWAGSPGAVSGTPGAMQEQSLRQIEDMATSWGAANGQFGGVTGDPYNPEG